MRENKKQAYENIIFPAIYKMSYQKAIQSNIIKDNDEEINNIKKDNVEDKVDIENEEESN